MIWWRMTGHKLVGKIELLTKDFNIRDFPALWRMQKIQSASHTSEVKCHNREIWKQVKNLNTHVRSLSMSAWWVCTEVDREDNCCLVISSRGRNRSSNSSCWVLMKSNSWSNLSWSHLTRSNSLFSAVICVKFAKYDLKIKTCSFSSNIGQNKLCRLWHSSWRPRCYFSIHIRSVSQNRMH